MTMLLVHKAVVLHNNNYVAIVMHDVNFYLKNKGC